MVIGHDRDFTLRLRGQNREVTPGDIRLTGLMVAGTQGHVALARVPEDIMAGVSLGIVNLATTRVDS